MAIMNSTPPKAFGHKKLEVPQTTLAPKSKPKCYLERRKASERSKQFKRVQVIFNNGCCTYDAVLRNLSKEGARIEVKHPLEIPDTFTLKFTNDFKTEQCQIVWRDDKFIGLRFISP